MIPLSAFNLYLTYELKLQFIRAERGEVQGAGGSQPGQLHCALFGLLHGLGLPQLVLPIQRRLGLGRRGLGDG